MSMHKETLNKHKLTMLKRGAEEVIRTGYNVIDIGIFRDSINDYNNWQKLRYCGLIWHVTQNGQVIRGKWLITRNGWAFLRGEIDLPKWVLVQDNHIIDRSPERINVKDVYRGSESIVTTFEYFDDNGRPIGHRPTAKPDLQVTLL